MKTFKIIFPLCLFNYPTEITDKYNFIISYGVISFANRLMKSSFIAPSEENVENFVSENKIINYDGNNLLESHMIYACMIMGLVIKDINKCIIEYCKVQTYLNNYEKKYGKDAQVKVGSDLLLEVRDGKFSERLFRCYCAIKSILGKKDFCRITNKTIAYRMKGFKKIEIMNLEDVSINESLTDRQISTLTKTLKRIGFIERGTYKRRCTYYSTKFRGDRFNEKLSDFLSSKKVKRECQNIQNEILNNKTANKYEKKIKEMRVNQTVNCKIYDIGGNDEENNLKGFKYGEH